MKFGSPVNGESEKRQASPSGFVAFSTDGVKPADRFEFWRSQFGAVHSVDVIPEQRPGFTATGSTWRLGPVLIGAFNTPRRRIVRDTRQMRQDDIDHIILRVPRNCQIRSSSGDSRIVVHAGELSISSYSGTYDDDVSEGEWVCAILDRIAFPKLWGRSITPQVLRGTSAALLCDLLLGLPDRLSSMTQEETPVIAEAVQAMIATCLAGCLEPDHAELARMQFLLRRNVDHIIAENLSSPRLNPERIAKLAGVSRSTLYRAFDQEGGIAGHLLDRRLDLIRRDLALGSMAELPVARIAERRGLYNAASFHRAFRQRFGVSPAAYRSAVRAEQHEAKTFAPTSGENRRPRFIDLLRTPAD